MATNSLSQEFNSAGSKVIEIRSHHPNDNVLSMLMYREARFRRTFLWHEAESFCPESKTGPDPAAFRGTCLGKVVIVAHSSRHTLCAVNCELAFNSEITEHRISFRKSLLTVDGAWSVPRRATAHGVCLLLWATVVQELASREPSLQRIVGNITPQCVELLAAADQVVEALLLPESSATAQNPIDLCRRKFLP